MSQIEPKTDRINRAAAEVTILDVWETGRYVSRNARRPVEWDSEPRWSIVSVGRDTSSEVPGPHPTFLPPGLTPGLYRRTMGGGRAPAYYLVEMRRQRRLSADEAMVITSRDLARR